jgi:excisionase family DNA binding protein
MAMYSLSEAAKATGLNRSTLFRAIRSGRISATRDAQGQWALDPAEVHRVYAPVASPDAPHDAVQHDATGELEARIEGLKAVAELLRSQLADALTQRDKWQEAFTAQRLLPAPVELPAPRDATEDAPPATPDAAAPRQPQTWWSWLRSTA